MNKLNIALKINRSESLKIEPKNISNKKNERAADIKNNNDKVSISNNLKTDNPTKTKTVIASDVRYNLIKKYKAILSDGTYKIKSDELADKMIQKIKENKNKVLF
jgi:anti-sigma28 factor (negative regulator of flagellin synthesis)|tara:strand:- start:122 stop:436 length:315 start_codon:yes stop_codon:yes gene_type:complete